jgi:general bacterial porin, GBP family
MNKLLNALSATALIAVGAAAQAQSQAPLPKPGETTVYGVMAIDLLHVTNVYAGATGGSQTRIDNSTPVASRLGFKGAEDLGGGLSAVYNIEAGISPDTGTSNATAFWNRGSWVGLRDATWGTLTFGRQWNLEDRVLGRYFIFGGYAAFKFTEFVAIDDLVNNALKYVSPSLGGLEISLLAAPGEGVTGKVLEAGLNYIGGPFEIGGTYRRAEGLNGLEDTLTSVGASFKVTPSMRLHAGWSHANPQASRLREVDAYDLGAVWDITPTITTTLDYIARDQDNTDNDSNFVRLQGIYTLSKRTSVFANIVTLTNDGTANQRFVGTGAAGKGQDVYAIGMKHSF